MTNHDPLRDALEGLPREIQPQRDLWPDIEARLAEGTSDRHDPEIAAWRRLLRQRHLPTVGMVVAASLAVLLLAGPDRVSSPTSDPGNLATLEESYASVRSDVLEVLDDRCSQLPQAACDGLRSGLDDLDHCATDLRQALRTTPAGSAEARRLTIRYHRTLEKARGLAGHAARL
jgi:hypothetical protein